MIRLNILSPPFTHYKQLPNFETLVIKTFSLNIAILIIQMIIRFYHGKGYVICTIKMTNSKIAIISIGVNLIFKVAPGHDSVN
ncbi:hypothetical protein DYI25_20830 [Mesobacillus boroniphilus]|uniref:Uncharacterized protein n=1 Tax=Mesobacillus boroniphilus TaxID=308892 RepID=A0A944GYD5_9BACI|nr:hypothetical protein [Mesobacillus boroniphilus]